MLFSATHIAEDVALRVYETRFHVPLLIFGFAVSLAYALQIAAAALTALGKRGGVRLNVVLAATWFLAALLDHGWEIVLLPTHDYRAGLISKAIAGGLIATSAWWLYASTRLLRKHMN